MHFFKKEIFSFKLTTELFDKMLGELIGFVFNTTGGVAAGDGCDFCFQFLHPL